MKTLYITRGNNIIVDTENNSCNKLNTAKQGIDYIYLAEEPMHVVYGCGEYNKELDVEEGDIIVTFYSPEFNNKIIAIKNSEWVENILTARKKEQEAKELWAKRASISRDDKTELE